MSGNTSNAINSVCQISSEVSKELDNLADRAFQLQKHARALQEKLSVKTDEKAVQVDTVDNPGFTVLDTVPAHMQRAFAFKPFDRHVNWAQLKALNLDRMIKESDTRALLDMLEDLSRADLESESVYNTTESNLFKVIKAQQLLLQYLQDSLARQQRQRRRLEEDRAAVAGDLNGMAAARADADLEPVATGLRNLQQRFEGLAYTDLDALVRQVRLEERMAQRNAMQNALADGAGQPM